MKEKTLEEAAENGWFNTNSMSAEHKEGFEEGFIQGAKWQQERMYSEEEVLKLLISCKESFGGSDLDDYVADSKVIKWFEQFKKQ